ncbi:MAG TPA: DUF1573 domain-containing protein [Bacteroidales bacterium]|nr:DUF1573 domain-containing protein [Bacteroidales bacterium]
MKSSFVAISLLVVGMLWSVSVRANGPALNFTQDRIDFGTVYTDKMPEFKYSIEFTNAGNAPLILNAVRACCGTRVVSWPQEPVLPGQKGIIEIEFRLAPRAQRVSRTVTVTSNDTANPTAILRIMGQVADRAPEPPR